jgi:hypothetical protein
MRWSDMWLRATDTRTRLSLRLDTDRPTDADGDDGGDDAREYDDDKRIVHRPLSLSLVTPAFARARRDDY